MPSPQHGARGPSFAASIFVLLPWMLPLAAGVWLRVVGLRDQVLIGDERWEITAALERTLPELFRHLTISNANYSPPLAALHRIMLESGLEPGELALRAPVWLCGLLLLVGMPFALRRWLPVAFRYPLCWLLATSPLLVFYSRMVRGYLPLLLLCVVATLAALHCIETGSRRTGALYALASGLAVSMHLLALPFVVAPLLFAGAVLLLAQDRTALTGRSWLVLGFAVGAAILLFVAPAWQSILWLLGERGGEGRPGLDVFGGSLARLAGAGSMGVGLLFWGLVGLGAWRLWKRAPLLAGITMTQIGVQLLAVACVGPVGAEVEVLYTRYVMVVLPSVLLLVAASIAPSSAYGPRRRLAFAAFAACFIAALYFSGPLSRPLFHEGSFVHEWAHKGWRDVDVMLPALESERFYASLHEPARAGSVIETLWHGVAFPATASAQQRIHGQPVIVASLHDRWWDDPRLALRNALHPRVHKPEIFLASRARWLVVHVDPRAETLVIRARDEAWARFELPNFLRNIVAAEEIASLRLAKTLRRAWGTPDHADRWIMAWDLDRVRAELAAGGSGGRSRAGASRR